MLWNKGESASLILDLQSPKSPRLGFLLNGKWNGWSFNIQRNFGPKSENPDPFYLSICCAHYCEITIENYKQGISSITKYIQTKFENNEFDLFSILNDSKFFKA